MIDLTTDYLGLTLKNPLVVSASPLCEDLGHLREMEVAGAAAIVLHSLFEEQIMFESHELDRHLSSGTESFAESLTYFPEMKSYHLGPEAYLEYVGRAKAAVDIPIIASLNGVSTGVWIEYAQKIEEAGADALELNIYFIPTSVEMTGGQVEQMYIDLVQDVKRFVHIPVAVKLSPYFSSMANMAWHFDRVGADALVLFNRFYQPDFDLEKLEVVPHLTLSSSAELKTRLHWAAILFGQIQADIAITGGVHTAGDVIKSMMAGARVVMLASVLLKQGVGYLATLLVEVMKWMKEHEYHSIRQMQGSMSQRSVAEPAAFERGNYLRVLSSYALPKSGR